MPSQNTPGLACLIQAAMASSSAFLFFSILLLLVSDHCAIADLQNDAQALLAFKNNLSKNATKLSSWQNATNVCVSWAGVTCGNSSSSSDQRVLALRLPGRSLYGSIAEGTLGKLDSLQVLSLRNNRLRSFPSDLSNCTSLRELYLHNNEFSGPLPSNFSAWPRLRRIDLSSNSFNGSIPPSLNDSTNLRYLRLQDNNLTGSIPSLSGIAANLQNFSVARNNLSGSIPSYLARFGQESFAGNSDLCGSPLPTPCPSTPSPSPSPSSPAPASSSSPSPTTSSPSQTSPSPSPIPPQSGSGLKPGVIAAIVIGSAIGALLLLSLCYILCLRRPKSKDNTAGPPSLYAAGRESFQSRYAYHNGTDNIKTINSEVARAMQVAAVEANIEKSSGYGSSATASVDGRRAPNKLTFVGDDDGRQNYDLDELLRASAEVLGKGSFGTSYKAIMSDGLTLVVKRLKEAGGSPEDEATCKAAMEKLGGLRHPNLVPFRAFFFTEKEKLIISDHMPQGSLSSLLHGNGNSREPLEWEARLRIASQAANGLVFLHSKKVVHGGIKSSNVLLDKEGAARWSDYGLLTEVAARAPGVKPGGYTPPEAAPDARKINYKGDVYSFGVLLLELVTGKSPQKLLLEPDSDLPKWVESRASDEDAMDPAIQANRELDDVLGLLRIALLCVSPSPEKRPHMVEIVKSVQDLAEKQAVA